MPPVCATFRCRVGNGDGVTARRSGDHRRGGLYGYGLANWARQDPASIAGGSPGNRRELARIPQAQLAWDGDENDAVLPCFRVAEVSGQLDFGRLPVQPESDQEVSVAGFERSNLSYTSGGMWRNSFSPGWRPIRAGPSNSLRPAAASALREATTAA